MKIQEVRTLLTKFFYNANQLHFQILIQTESDLVLHGEYDDYKIYKTAFDQIHQALRYGVRLKSLTEKNELEMPLAKVA